VQVLLGILAILLGLLFCIVLLILVCPCHYFIKVNKQENLWGVLTFQIGFLKLEKISQKKKEKVEKKRRMFFRRLRLCDWRELLERETFSLLVEIGKEVWAKIRPKYLWFKGRFGFADPYYTGLLAAVLSGFRRENVDFEFDFSQAVCEFALQIEGRISLIVLIYYFLRFLLIYPLRSIVWGKFKRC
jgi:hypothetical protein